jgi:hypothetical protein
MHRVTETEMRMRTAELSLVIARRRRAALSLLPHPTTRTEVVAQLQTFAAIQDAERRATTERARAVRARYLPELVA